VTRPGDLGLIQHGVAIPTQARVLDRWADGSIRWVLLDAQVSAEGTVDPELAVVHAGAAPPPPGGAIRSSGSGNDLVVDTGAARFVFPRGTGQAAFLQVDVPASGSTTAPGCRLEFLGRNGASAPVEWSEPGLTESGPLRVAVRVNGRCALPADQGRLDVFLRLHFFAGSATVKAQVTIRNPRKAEHPGGFWDLGDPGSVFIRDASLVLGLPSGAAVRRLECSLAPGEPAAQATAPFELYQDSSGGAQWDSVNHVNRDHVVPNAFRGYRVRSGHDEATGLRATPAVTAIQDTGGTFGLAVPLFWQNFPKAVEATDAELRVGLFPRQYADVHEIQGGEQKTHDIFLAFGRDRVTDRHLEWALDSTVVHADPAYYASTGVLPYLTPEATDPRRVYLDLVRSAIEGPDTFFDKRERVDEYGWRHYGDVYGDHEAVRHTGPGVLTSHYNNQYDTTGGFLFQFLRSGDLRWWDQGAALARHVVDVDVYHTTEDKPAYNHGMFWHTYHYGHADTATHRTYPLAGKGHTHGGGPSADHNYTTGLMLYHFLTGDELARETVADLAQYVLDIDDGAKTPFRWLDRGHTGGASKSAPDYFGPGRAPANSLNALVDGHRVTGRREFLDKAEALIRRSVHPRETLERHNLLEPELRWFYTMFLQSLGKYLDYKVEIGQLDRMYAYARAAMVRYGEWMATHETPYSDRRDRLEFPTETWPAQDIRKADIFNYASLHAEEPLRSRLRERAQFFFDYATRTLGEAPTRRLARPVIVLLTSGVFHQWFVEHPNALQPAPAVAIEDFGPVETFVPQRVRAMKRAKLAVGAGAVVGLGVAAWVALLLFF
jgi:hypothetical protein